MTDFGPPRETISSCSWHPVQHIVSRYLVCHSQRGIQEDIRDAVHTGYDVVSCNDIMCLGVHIRTTPSDIQTPISDFEGRISRSEGRISGPPHQMIPSGDLPDTSCALDVH